MPRGEGERPTGGGPDRRIRVDRIVVEASGGKTPPARKIRREIRAELRRRLAARPEAIEGERSDRRDRIRVETGPAEGTAAADIARRVADAVQRAADGSSREGAAR